MNISQALLRVSHEFGEKKINNYSLEAEMLLSFVLGKSREYLFTHGEDKVTFWDRLRLKYFIARRFSGYSLAVIIGEKGFYGLDFYVNKNVLVPRPETELMISSVLELELESFNLIDVGAGSGCIPITLLKKMGDKIKKTIAIDISEKALKVSRRNAKRHGVYDAILFIKSNLLSELIKKNEKFDGMTVITANLPYLTSKQVDDSPSVKKEPRIALVAGEDGLLYYDELFKTIKNNRNNFDGSLFIFCEIDEVQIIGIGELIYKIFGDVLVEVKKDLQGLKRLVIIKL